jgi:hypothetical protein
VPEPNLGKLIAVHSTSPAFLQRAAIVAALSFLFFLIALIFYLVWQSFLFFVLATGFLIVQLFTMIGWWMQKRSAVSIFAKGFVYRKRSILWDEVIGAEIRDDSSLDIELSSSEVISLAPTIQELGRLRNFIRERLD